MRTVLNMLIAFGKMVIFTILFMRHSIMWGGSLVSEEVCLCSRVTSGCNHLGGEAAVLVPAHTSISPPGTLILGLCHSSETWFIWITVLPTYQWPVGLGFLVDHAHVKLPIHSGLHSRRAALAPRHPMLTVHSLIS